MPLFHRPSFETSVAEGLHLQDPSFGATLLLVCAIGSRYSDDPRVLYDGTTSTHSAGWKWFEQVSVIRRSFIPPPSLRELQNFAVCTFLPETPKDINKIPFTSFLSCLHRLVKPLRVVGRSSGQPYVWLRKLEPIDVEH